MATDVKVIKMCSNQRDKNMPDSNLATMLHLQRCTRWSTSAPFGSIPAGAGLFGVKQTSGCYSRTLHSWTDAGGRNLGARHIEYLKKNKIW